MSAETIGVCGFGRCGSSMLMAMLDAGGVPPVDGSAERSYELPRLELLASLGESELAGRAVKLLDGIDHFPLPEVPWRFIWLDRDPHEQAKSFEKFVRFLQVLPPDQELDLRRIRQSYIDDRPRTLRAYEALGPVLVLQYEKVLLSPEGAAHFIAGHINVDRFDITAASSVVHRRPPECRSGMLFEQYGVNA